MCLYLTVDSASEKLGILKRGPSVALTTLYFSSGMFTTIVPNILLPSIEKYVPHVNHGQCFCRYDCLFTREQSEHHMVLIQPSNKTFTVLIIEILN